MTKVLRRITLLGATGQLRTAKYQDREHIVVPTIALMEGVIWSANADAPAFVSAAVLSTASGEWNGRPCFVDHPQVDGQYVSGNHPALLPTSFGTIFGAKDSSSVLSSKKLEVEAWLDPEKAETLGEKNVVMIQRLQAGEVVEVSTGLMAVEELAPGVYNGKHYKYVWSEIHSDHLAFLSEGDIGACSVDMGCGAPRVATVHLVTPRGLRANVQEAKQPMIRTLGTRTRPEGEPRSLRQRLLALVGRTEEEPFPFLTAEQRANITVMGLMQELDAQLRAVEPGYIYIEDVDLDGRTVQYCVAPENIWLTYQRTYRQRGDTVTINDDRVQVEAVTKYEPVAASASASAGAAVTSTPDVPCGCGGQSPAAPAVSASEEHPIMKTKKDIIAGLIASGRFKETERSVLEASHDSVLQALDAQPATLAAETPEELAARETREQAERDEAARITASATRPQTVDEYVANAPGPMREVLISALATAKAKKAATITALKASNRCDIPDAELNVMSQIGLDRLCKLAGVDQPAAAVDYSLTGVPRQQAASDDAIPAPPSLHDRIRANRTAGRSH
jgi:hypothetical protein